MTVFAKFRGPKHSVRDHSGEFRKVRSGPDSSQPFTTLKRMILANVISSCSIFLPQEGFASANSSKRSIRSLGDMAESLDRRSTTIATGLRDSMPSLAKRRSSAYDTPPPFLPPRRPYTKHPGRPGDFRNVSPRTASPSSSVTRPSSSDYAATGERDIQLPSSQRQERHVALGPPSNTRPLPHNPRLHALRTGEYSTTSLDRLPCRRPHCEDTRRSAQLEDHPTKTAYFSPYTQPCSLLRQRRVCVRSSLGHTVTLR